MIHSVLLRLQQSSAPESNRIFKGKSQVHRQQCLRRKWCVSGSDPQAGQHHHLFEAEHMGLEPTGPLQSYLFSKETAFHSRMFQVGIVVQFGHAGLRRTSQSAPSKLHYLDALMGFEPITNPLGGDHSSIELQGVVPQP